MTTRLLTAIIALGLLAQGSDTQAQGPTQQEEVVLSLAQMRIAAARAIKARQYELAISMAQAMLIAHPDDSYPHFIIAQAYLRNGQPDEARPAARLSYKLAKTPVQKHEAARVAALTAAAQDRFLPAQIWMRRALVSVPDGVMKQRAVAEFRAVRREAKVQLTFGFAVSPSSNVNGGSSEELNTIEGFPLVGILSPDAQALSGTIAQTNLGARYRLHRSAFAQSHAHGGLQVRRVSLSDAARDKAPKARGDTYNSTLFEFGLSHTQKLGQQGPFVKGGLFGGRVWFGGDPAYDYGRSELSMVQMIGTRTALSLGAGYQEQWHDAGAFSDIRTTQWSAGISHLLGNKDRVSLSFQTAQSLSDNTQQANDTRTLRLGYNLARPVGPVKLSGDLIATERAFPDYRVILPVPGGREDTGYAANLDMTFHTLDYAGFVPTVRLSAERNDSNVSRFETEEFSVSIGFESAF